VFVAMRPRFAVRSGGGQLQFGSEDDSSGERGITLQVPPP
jgi:hypothetical protein